MINRKHFTSRAAYLDWVGSLDWNRHHTTGFTTEANVRAGMDNLATGRPDLVSEAQKLMDELSLELDTPRRTWKPSIAGAYPSVPAYLSGMPESMFTLTPSWREDSPIRVWLGVTSSASITSEQLLRRGVALAAFAMALSETRTVTLTPYILSSSVGHGRDAYISWDLQTSPLVLSEVCASLADVAVIRYLGLWATDHLNNAYSPTWTNDYADETKMRSILGCAEDDVWLSSIHANDPLLTDPVGWIRSAVVKYAGEDAS